MPYEIDFLGFVEDGIKDQKKVDHCTQDMRKDGMEKGVTIILYISMFLAGIALLLIAFEGTS